MGSVAVLVILAGLVSAAAAVNYAGQLVVRVTVSPDHKIFNQLTTLNDVWDMDAETQTVVVRLSNVDNLEVLSYYGLKYEVLIKDLQQFMAENDRRQADVHADGVDEWFEEFHNYDEIIDWYHNLTAGYPAIARYAGVLGVTVGNRQVHGFLLGGRADGSKKLFFQAGLHAREWASPATVAYLFDKLVRGYGTDSNATALLDTYQIAFIPVANPDGYAYTWSTDRLWRKNRRPPPPGSSCFGVDLNRNWDSQGYGEGHGSSPNPCSDTYHGVAAFSEAETAASSGWFRTLGPLTVKGAIDFHAYGRYVLRPYGWPVTPTNREAELTGLGDATAAAIEDVYSTRWTSQRSAQLYPAAGGTEDWMFDFTDGSCNAFCFELRGNSFMLPPEEIVLSGEETWAGIKVWATMIDQMTEKKSSA